jgi:hypothetical protein
METSHWFYQITVAVCLAVSLAVYGSGSVTDRMALKHIFSILVFAILYAHISYGNINIESCIVTSNTMSPAVNLTEIIGTSNITHATKTTECIKFILYQRNVAWSFITLAMEHNTQYTLPYSSKLRKQLAAEIRLSWLRIWSGKASFFKNSTLGAGGERVFRKRRAIRMRRGVNP